MPALPTLVWCTGFEYGVVASSGASVFTNVSGTPTVQNSVVRSGGYSLFIDSPGGGTSTNVRHNHAGTPQIAVTRGYIRIPTGGLPNANSTLLGWQILTAATTAGFQLSTLGVARAIVGSGTAIVSSITLNLDQWYRIDMRLIITGTTWTLDWAVDGIEQTQATWVGQATTDSIQGLRIGSSSTTAVYKLYADDIALSETSADYPIGPGRAIKLSPIADGTHSPSTPDCIRGGAAAPALISGSNQAWQYMDDVPFPFGASPTTDRISKDLSTTTHPAHYVEMTFEQLTGQLKINGVSGLLAYGGDSATANNGSTIAVNSAGTESSIYGTSATGADMSEITVFYKGAMVTAPAVGWNIQEVNALKMRLGYGNDVSPVPFWQALMFEIDVTDLPIPFFKVNGQSVRRTSLF